jgi:hypothetical protein
MIIDRFSGFVYIAMSECSNSLTMFTDWRNIWRLIMQISGRVFYQRRGLMGDMRKIGQMDKGSADYADNE